MNEVPELVVGTIYVMPIIIALVELAKQAGLDVKYTPWLNGALCVVFYGVTVLLKSRPDLEAIAVTVLSAMLLFLINSGVYNVAAKSAVKAMKGG